jgi:hypothetical protein
MLVFSSKYRKQTVVCTRRSSPWLASNLAPAFDVFTLPSDVARRNRASDNKRHFTAKAKFL